MKPAYLSMTPAEGESGGQFKRRMRRARAEWYREKFAGQPTELPWSRGGPRLPSTVLPKEQSERRKTHHQPIVIHALAAALLADGGAR